MSKREYRGYQVRKGQLTVKKNEGGKYIWVKRDVCGALPFKTLEFSGARHRYHHSSAGHLRRGEVMKKCGENERPN